jgi:hypothetical protein
MLCVSLRSYARSCSGVTGGLSDILFFDPSDFDFTQAASTDPYTVVTRRAGATAVGGALMYPVTFNENEAERTWKQSRKGCAVKYSHEVHAQLPQLSNGLTTFLQALDAAGCCCGLGIIMRHQDGKIFVMGEKYVNATQITKFTAVMDGSDGGTGKLLDDFNGANVVIKADYSRDLREFTGDWSVIQGFADGVAALAMTTQPQSNAYATGGTLVLTADATGGTQPYTYQWKKGGTNISGATSSGYSKSGLVSGDAGSYTRTTTDAVGANVTSAAAVITVV